MKTKILCIIISSVLLMQCQSDPKKNCSKFSFDQNEYALVNTMKDSLGRVDFELYQHKKDTSRYFSKRYWDNGNILSMTFFSGSIKDGPSKIYDMDGHLKFETMFVQNKKTGVEIFYNRDTIIDFQIYYNDQEILDTASKIAMLKNLSQPKKID